MAVYPNAPEQALWERSIRAALCALDRHGQVIACLLAALIIVAGVAYSYRLGDTLRTVDERHYFYLANNLAETGMFTLDRETPNAFRAPGYPIMLAPFLYLGAAPVHVRILNFFLLAATLILFHRLLARLFSMQTATLTVLLLSGYPILLYQAGSIYPESLGTLYLVVLLYCITLFPRKTWAHVVGGLLLGLLILTIPAFIFSVPLFALWLLYYHGKSAFARYCLALALLVLVTGAWSVRNTVAFGQFVFISANAGKNLLYGNSEHTTWNSGTLTNIDSYLAERDRLGLVKHSVEEDSLHRTQAVAYIKAHPLRVAGLYVGKFANYYHYHNKLASKTVSISPLQRVVLFVTFMPYLLLFLARIATIPWRPLRPVEMLFIGLHVGSGLFYAIFFTRVRFRLPFDYLLMAIAASFLLAVISTKLLGEAEQAPSDAGSESAS
jgi:4-amino-4-deoxy-L-arabinose transferase-like glycosyltransferase